MCISRKMGKYVLFSVVHDKIACLICSKAVTAPKEDKFGVLEGSLREN
jgi:hypothetical protein